MAYDTLNPDDYYADWDEDPGVEPGGCPVGFIPHPLGSDPEGCVNCRDHQEQR